MRALFVVSSPERRGAQIEALSVAGALNRRGTRVDVVAVAGGHGPQLDIARLGTNPRSVATLRELRSRARDVDVVIAYGSTALPASALALPFGTPWIYRSIGDPCAWIRGPLHRERTGLLVRRARLAVALWPAAARSIQTLYRLSNDRVTVVGNGRDPAAFPPVTDDERRAARAATGQSPDARVALVLGALSPEKCVEDAIAATGRCENLRLVIAGDGPERDRLQALAERLCPGRATFLGNVAEPAGIIAAADVTLLTSRTEGVPASAIESLFRGVPVVATRVGATSEIVKDGETGGLVPVGDIAAISAAIDEVIDRPRRAVLDDRDRLSSIYGLDAVATAWEDVLQRVASGPARRR